MARPRLRFKVKSLLKKARDASCLAVSVYNNPTTTFRTYGFVVLMNIAWTSLFHAIFERNKVRYYYRDRNDRRRYERIDGDYKAWELSKSAAVYFGDQHEPARQNIDFFVGLRNKIEHRFAPEIDVDVFGECQSYLINFKNILVRDFGADCALADTLLFALQFSKIRSAEQLSAIKKTHSKHLREIRDYIYNFRRGLEPSVLADPEYALRVYLIQKTSNHPSSADAAIEFVKFDPNNPEEMLRYQHLVTIIKEKQLPVTAPPVVVRLAADKSEPHERVLLAERRNPQDLPLVGLTRDPEKASGVLVIEQLSDDFFDDAVGIVDAAMLFHRRFGEVNLSKRALYFTYAGRGKIVNSDAARILVDVCYTSYTPLHYWLTVLDPESILSFMKKAFTKTNYPRVRAFIRLFFAIGPGPWRDYIIMMHDRINHYSQKPNWYWFVDRLAKKIDAAEPIYVALEAEPHHTLLGKSISEFVGNQLLSDQYLSKACAEFASERPIDESAVRKLDLIVHFQSVARLLPPPNGMPEDLSRIDSSTHSRSSSRYISEDNMTLV